MRTKLTVKNRALITGILGQDGALLAELLISLDYDVYGVYRRISSGNNFDNLASIKSHPRLHLIQGDITDGPFINSLLADLKPDFCFHTAAQSHVGYSFKNPIETLHVNATGTLLLLEAIKNFSPKTHFINCATSEMFGGVNCPDSGYNESSPLHARSPYAASKICAFQLTRNYREAYNLFACSTIGFNHSSIYRGYDFALRTITSGVAAIKLGKAKNVAMGNIDTYRDESHAKDVVRAMVHIANLDNPDDFVVASGKAVSIRQMLEIVCGFAGLDPKAVYVKDESKFRPAEVEVLKGDSSKLLASGFEFKYNLEELLYEMYEHDLKLLGG